MVDVVAIEIGACAGRLAPVSPTRPTAETVASAPPAKARLAKPIARRLLCKAGRGAHPAPTAAGAFNAGSGSGAGPRFATAFG